MGKIYWVRGNTQTLLIPLEQEIVPQEGEIVTEPYYPVAGRRVLLPEGGRRRRPHQQARRRPRRPADLADGRLYAALHLQVAPFPAGLPLIPFGPAAILTTYNQHKKTNDYGRQSNS